MAAFAGCTDKGLMLALGEVPPSCLPVIVGVDFGTACSGVSITYKATPDAVKYGAPTATDQTQVKAPTALLIRSDGSYEFGNSAEAKYNEMLASLTEGDPLPAQLYKRFKMVLKDRHEGFDRLSATSIAGVEAPLMDLVVKVLTKLKDFALGEVYAGYGAHVDPLRNVQWVLTVPAIWTDFAKAFMRRAAYHAGLVASEQSDNLMLVLEPEGAALAVHVGAAEHGLLGEGSRFMVLDCGGGTVDITTYEVAKVAPLELKAIAAPSGGAWGGEYVNEEFRKFLKELLGPELYRETEQPYEFYTIFMDFDKVKVAFEPTKDPANIRLVDLLDNKKQLVTLAETWNSNHPDRPILMTPTLRNGFLPMSKELMLSFFEPLLQPTVDETAKVIRENPGIRYIIVVGGFGASRVVTERIKAEFHQKSGVRVVLPDAQPKPQAAVVHGAAYYGLYMGASIRTRVARYTYGVAMRINGVDEVFSILVSKGEELDADHEAFLMGMPISPEQERIVWRVYRSERPEPTTVIGEHLLGTVTADCPRHPEPIKRRQTGLYRFGGAEIRVTIENAEGRKFNGEIKMD